MLRIFLFFIKNWVGESFNYVKSLSPSPHTNRQNAFIIMSIRHSSTYNIETIRLDVFCGQIPNFYFMCEFLSGICHFILNNFDPIYFSSLYFGSIHPNFLQDLLCHTSLIDQACVTFIWIQNKKCWKWDPALGFKTFWHYLVFLYNSILA